MNEQNQTPLRDVTTDYVKGSHSDLDASQISAFANTSSNINQKKISDWADKVKSDVI